MKLEEMKDVTFTPYAIDDWVSKAEESLKGRKIDSLSTSTYENIVLKPLYTKEDIETSKLSLFPGAANFRRGRGVEGYHKKPWYVANKLAYSSVEELAIKLNAAYSAGQTGFAIEGTEELFADEAKLEELLQHYSSLIPFSVNAKGFLKPLLDKVVKVGQGNNGNVQGFIAADIVAEAAATGGFSQPEAAMVNQWEQVIQDAHQALPDVKTILADTSIYHNGGANAVQELGIALATGVFYVQELLDKGWKLDEALEKLIFHFSIGANFFMETAKLRAARILWDKAMEAYGALEESRKMEISAETSHFTKTVFDPYVNLLRAGNEAFSAILGGVQYLSVGALDEASGKTSAFSERIARNTQLILKAEAQLEKVTDPVGGSWYIETLTRELAEKAWEYFLAIEDQGGIIEAIKSNWLQNEIAAVRAQREIELFTRKRSLIGTNVYANVVEETVQEQEESDAQASGQFKPIRGIRLSQPYEELRFKALELEKQHGKKPSVGLICLGELKKHKARADFITGFLASGGIETSKSQEIDDQKDAFDFIQASGLEHYCICGDHRGYDEQALDLVKELKSKFPNIQLSMAGIPDESLSSAFKEAGVVEFWHVKSNNFEILSTLIKELEVSTR